MEKIFIFVDSSKCWIASCIPVELKIILCKSRCIGFPVPDDIIVLSVYTIKLTLLYLLFFILCGSYF